MVCRDFILPEIANHVSFIFAKLIVPYRHLIALKRHSRKSVSGVRKQKLCQSNQPAEPWSIFFRNLKYRLSSRCSLTIESARTIAGVLSIKSFYHLRFQIMHQPCYLIFIENCINNSHNNKPDHGNLYCIDYPTNVTNRSHRKYITCNAT